MDAIQDGLLLLNKFPEGGLLRGIFYSTKPGSHLRLFAVAGLLYNLRHPANAQSVDISKVAATLTDMPEILNEFLSGVQSLNVSAADFDPRVRDCGGEQGCSECIHKQHLVQPGRGGVWPCTFHVHTTESEYPGEELGFDEGCYLWEI